MALLLCAILNSFHWPSYVLATTIAFCVRVKDEKWWGLTKSYVLSKLKTSKWHQLRRLPFPVEILFKEAKLICYHICEKGSYTCTKFFDFKSI